LKKSFCTNCAISFLVFKKTQFFCLNLLFILLLLTYVMVNKDYQKVYCNVFTDHIIDGFRETQLMQLLRGRRIIRRL